MKIYTNERDEIVAVNSSVNPELHEYEIDDNFFKGKCDQFIFGYKYEPSYEYQYDEKGEILKGEDGEPLYILDDNGKKKVTAYSLYPFIDYTQLSLIQAEHERNELLLYMADMIGGNY